MTKVMLFGTFDHVHKGHINLFNQAKQYGFVIAVIARDKTIFSIRNFFPKFNEKKRQNDVSKYVDKAVLGNIHKKHNIILRYKPEIICLGYDQKYFVHDLYEFLIKNRLKTKIIKLKPYKAHIYKSSKLKYKK